jgi:hypothetical protein
MTIDDEESEDDDESPNREGCEFRRRRKYFYCLRFTYEFEFEDDEV